jgi:Tfp pilus assembly protein PilO
MTKLLFPIVAILICGAVYFTVISPAYSNVSQMKVDVATYNAALTNSKYLQTAQDTLLSQYNSIQADDKTRLEHFLPSSINNIEFILEIEQLANLHNMPITDITFDAASAETAAASTTAGTPSGTVTAGDPASTKPYGVFPLEFTTSGSYDSFVSFLKDMEHNLRLVDVTSVSFTVPQATKADPNPSSYDYTVKVNTYWLK